MEQQYDNSDIPDERCVDDIADLIRENCPNSTVTTYLIERITVSCECESEADMVSELVKAGFQVRIKTDTEFVRSLIKAERVASR